ncbi:MAG: hypothetical protein SYC29_03105, partial [Planctomycetota bacterium]|nr:hypothetical protein [Planctomycetota bacterium]
MTRCLTILVLTILAAVAGPSSGGDDGERVTRYDNHRLVRAWPQSADQIEKLHDLGAMLLSDHEGIGGAPVDY